MKEKDKQRRLNTLCGTIGPLTQWPGDEPFSILSNIKTFEYVEKEKPTPHNQYLKDRLELLKLSIELGYTDQEAYDHWRVLSWEQRKRKEEYKRKPTPVHKDNPNTYGEEFHGYGTKRQPRKCRKTAWKRFKKLFPEHKIV